MEKKKKKRVDFVAETKPTEVDEDYLEQGLFTSLPRANGNQHMVPPGQNNMRSSEKNDIGGGDSDMPDDDEDDGEVEDDFNRKSHMRKELGSQPSLVQQHRDSGPPVGEQFVEANSARSSKFDRKLS